MELPSQTLKLSYHYSPKKINLSNVNIYLSKFMYLCFVHILIIITHVHNGLNCLVNILGFIQSCYRSCLLCSFPLGINSLKPVWQESILSSFELDTSDRPIGDILENLVRTAIVITYYL